MFGTSTTFDFETKYYSFDYWRYQYYKNSGVGMLVAVDAAGNPLNPDTPSPEPEKPDPNQNVINAVGRTWK